MNQHMIEQWQAWYAAGGDAESTVRLRGYQLRRLAEQVDLEQATEADLVAYMAEHAGRAPNSRKSTLAAIRSFYRWAHRTGRMPVDPTVGLRGVSAPAGVPRPVPAEVFEAAFAQADTETRLMLALGYFAGLRRAEIARVHADDITDGWLTVTGKGGRVRRVPVAARLRPLLAGVAGWAFPSPRRPGMPVGPDYVEDRVCRVLHPYTCHQLRHAAATRWYGASRDIRAVQLLLGHASVATTQVYVATTDEQLLATVAAAA